MRAAYFLVSKTDGFVLSEVTFNTDVFWKVRRWRIDSYCQTMLVCHWSQTQEMIRFRSKQNGMLVNLSNRFTSVPLIGSRIYQKRRSVIVFEARTKTVSRNEKLIFPIRNLGNQQTDGEFHSGVTMRKIEWRRKNRISFFRTTVLLSTCLRGNKILSTDF